jgi:hypothetical protein
MSMSLFVILALDCDTTTSKLNEYSDELGYSIQYEKDIELKTHSGFLPATVSGRAAGVESYSFPVKELPDFFQVLVPQQLTNGLVYQFRFGGRESEAVSAFSTAILLNTKCNGVTIDDQTGTVIPVEQLIQGLSYFDQL